MLSLLEEFMPNRTGHLGNLGKLFWLSTRGFTEMILKPFFKLTMFLNENRLKINPVKLMEHHESGKKFNLHRGNIPIFHVRR